MKPLCKHCGSSSKAPGNPTSCIECWLAGQPIVVQVRYAEFRLSAMPQALRLSRVPDSDWPPGRRWCSGCQSFVRLRDVPKGAARCRACNSNAAHGRRVEATYGITREEYDALFAAQGGRCFICQRISHSKRLAVDHDHDTGKVRGLLCPDVERGCNYAILGNIRGKTLQDKIAMVYRIIIYLETPPAEIILN